MPRSSPGVPDCRPAGLPRLPPAHLPRPRLAARLRDGDWRLRLLVAPAGFGKTVLLGECLRREPPPRLVWLSLGGRAEPLAQVLDRLAIALGQVRPAGTDDQALSALLQAYPAPLWLVLDDYPHDPDPALDACLDRLLAQPDLPLRLLVSARQRPAWNLPRLLLAGDLLELDAGELAFDPAETQQLAERLAPGAGQPAALWRDTLGWCAGVPLLLAAPPASGGGPCWLKDYLDREVLARLKADARRDLLVLVHLPRVSAAFCAQLWDDGDGAARFEALLRRHAFFLPLDRQGLWYRPLPAVARALREHADAQLSPALRLRACRLFFAAGQVEDAIDQALAAGQPEVAASYLERLGQEWLTGERHLAHLLAWRERLPAHLLDGTPRLVVLNAWALLLAWRLDEADDCLERFGRFLPQPDGRRTRRLLANAQALRGALGTLRGRDPGEAARDCHAALAALDEQDWMPALLCRSALARIAFASGQPEQAGAYLDSAREQARRHGSVLFEVWLDLDRVQGLLLRGDTARARAQIDASLALIAQRDAGDALLLGRLQLADAQLLLQTDALDAAEDSLRRGLALAEDCADPLALLGYLGLAELAARRGDFQASFAELAEAERRMHCQQVWRLAYMGMLSLQRMQVLARQGNWARVETIGRRIQRYFEGERPWMAPCFAPDLALRNELLLARAQAAQGNPGAARPALLDLQRRGAALHYRPLVEAVRQALDALDAPTEPRIAYDAAIPDLLSQREQAVLHLLAEGYSNEEIGTRLFISVNTVKTHAKKINCKLGVKRRTQAVMCAKRLGLLA